MAEDGRADPTDRQAMFLTYTGMETDLIFTQGVPLPGFAAFALLETPEGRERIQTYYRDLIAIGAQYGLGVILESPTWVAHRDRAAALGYGAEALAALNRRAIDQMCAARTLYGDLPTLISANIGPRFDAYAPQGRMSVAEADDYHSEQIAVLAQTQVDLLSGYTLACSNEASGIVRAAKQRDLPVVIAFTVETDGRLPTGETLQDAIQTVDAATGGYAAYFMINCAHPDHFAETLEDAPWMQRLRGVVANASRCSHAELDDAQELDAGDPVALAQDLSAIARRFAQISVLGGCCGTDMRHLAEIAKQAPKDRAVTPLG